MKSIVGVLLILSVCTIALIQAHSIGMCSAPPPTQASGSCHAQQTQQAPIVNKLGSQVFPRQKAPQFSGVAVIGGDFKKISLNDYNGKYLVLIFYPFDFTYVCPTELIAYSCLLYTSPSPRDRQKSRMPSSA
eukprot:TRINITY_DN751_c0_g1_i4.p2 TRINITY_DN751_c0_g1~~TRINITY_DN751_c0_g1_i4.p2  ORF type:complete len:132 (+),score=31.43 TRINITY_DN751_c0_g1_i4:124-519(+)